MRLFFVLLLICVVNGKKYRVCVTTKENCHYFEENKSEVTCLLVHSRVECAMKIDRRDADFGVFSGEELLLLLQFPDTSRHALIATIRDRDREDSRYSFETVAIVSSKYKKSFDGLKGKKYCHPGLGIDEQWSPRVQKALEQSLDLNNNCSMDVNGKTPEELEVKELSEFFPAACRPGNWSYNSSVDRKLKEEYPNLCSLCPNGDCNNNIDKRKRVRALNCLVENIDNSVAYVNWHHVKEYFIKRNPHLNESFSVLCPDNVTVFSGKEVLNDTHSPCAFVRQPWGAIIANSDHAGNIIEGLKKWWPNGKKPHHDETWQSALYESLIPKNSRVFFEKPTLPSQYTSSIRPLELHNAPKACIPDVIWCTSPKIININNSKCRWISKSADVLGLQPRISCKFYDNNIDCMRALQNGSADFFTVDADSGHIARSSLNLSAIKLVVTQTKVIPEYHRISRIAELKENEMDEVLTRRDDTRNPISALLDSLDQNFGKNKGLKLIDMPLYSPFYDQSDSLFKDTTIRLTEPSIENDRESATNMKERTDECKAFTNSTTLPTTSTTTSTTSTTTTTTSTTTTSAPTTTTTPAPITPPSESPPASPSAATRTSPEIGVVSIILYFWICM